MERMNYINKDKKSMTDAERIKYLEESIRELRKEKENLKKEKGELKSRLEVENKKLKEEIEIQKKLNLGERMEYLRYIDELEEENKKLNEFKEKREESMFYFKAQMERAEPKTAREAEDLQKAKEIFEKLYREELSCLEEENKKLREERIFSLGEYDYMILTSTTPQLKIIKKNQNYSLMEEDTLQELRDIGEI